MMLVIEKGKRKPLTIRTCRVVNALGMVVFLILTIMVTWRDVVRTLA